MRPHDHWFNPLDHIGMIVATLAILGAAGILWLIANKALSVKARNKGLAKSGFAMAFIGLGALWIILFVLDAAGWLP